MSVLTLACEDQNDDPVVDALLSIYDTNLANLITSGRTDSSGVLTLSLPNGTYQVLGFANGYSFEEDEVVVSGATSHLVTSTKLTISAPGNPSVCRLYAFFKDMTGEAMEGVEVSVGNLFNQGSESVAGVVLNGVTNAQGLVYFDLVRGLRVRISVKGTSIVRDVVVPNLATQDLMTLSGMQTDAFGVVGEG